MFYYLDSNVAKTSIVILEASFEFWESLSFGRQAQFVAFKLEDRPGTEIQSK